MEITLVIADDHPVVLDGLVALLSLEKDFKIVAACRDGEGTLAAVKKYKPDILILDMRMPRLDGLALLRELKKEKLSTRTVLFTAELSEQELNEAVRLGVRGLILKNLAPKLIVHCIRDVHAGNLWLERHSASNAIGKLLEGEAARDEISQILTRRELEIVKHVSAGQRNAEIGKLLFISEGTVKMHLHNVYQKLNVDSRINLTRYVRSRSLF